MAGKEAWDIGNARAFKVRVGSSVAEQSAYNRSVVGSIPAGPTLVLLRPEGATPSTAPAFFTAHGLMIILPYHFK